MSSRPGHRDPASQGVLQPLLPKGNAVLVDNGFGRMSSFSAAVRACGTGPSALYVPVWMQRRELSSRFHCRDPFAIPSAAFDPAPMGHRKLYTR